MWVSIVHRPTALPALLSSLAPAVSQPQLPSFILIFIFFLAGGLQLSSLRWFCRAITRTAGEAAGGDGLNGLRSQQWMGTRWRGSGAAPQEPDVGSAAFPKVFIHPRQRPFNKKDFSVMENSVASI